MSTIIHRNSVADDVAMRSEQGVHDYALYGLRIRSDVALPVGRIDDIAVAIPDVTYTRAGTQVDAPVPDGAVVVEKRCDCPIHQGQVVVRVHRGPGGTWIWILEVGGTFHILPDGRRVDIYVNDLNPVTRHSLGLVLVGSVASLVLHRLGRPSLHASGVITHAGAAAFLGPKGQGKSTMAAGFVRRGARFITDDVLPLSEHDGTIVGHPSLPIMKLWRESVDHTLAIDINLPNVVRGLDKKLVTLDERYDFADEPVPLRAVYLLRRFYPDQVGHADISVRQLSRRDGVMTMLSATSQRDCLQSAEINQLLPIFGRLVQQAPVRELHYPDGFEHQEVVQQRILADLEESA